MNLNIVYKTKLDLTIDAPLIIVPQNSKSKTAVLLDCGTVRMETSLSISYDYFHNSKISYMHKIPPIIEKQTVKLLDVKISK